jgi:ribosomal protein L7/L12
VAKGNEAQAVKRYRELTGADAEEAQRAIEGARSDG